MKIKICGLKKLEDSLIACEAGADMVGFNFFPSSVRYISPENCRPIVERIKKTYPGVLTVGIFVNHSIDEIKNVLNYCHLDLAQLSGNEPIGILQQLGNKAFKAIRPKYIVEALDMIDELPRRGEHPAFLIDSNFGKEFGGTGRVGNWELAAQVAREYHILLAGGLNPENVPTAIEQVRPWGVDVASGVERIRGVKDLKLIKAFIQSVRSTTKPFQHK
jgi:phosphoribosylanthranilate isomerase